jgi:hypothetical protein
VPAVVVAPAVLVDLTRLPLLVRLQSQPAVPALLEVLPLPEVELVVGEVSVQALPKSFSSAMAGN